VCGFSHDRVTSKGNGCHKIACGATGAVEVLIDPMLGGRSPFFGNLDERLALSGAGLYYEKLNDYFRTGDQKGYRPLRNAADAFEEHLESCWELGGR